MPRITSKAKSLVTSKKSLEIISKFKPLEIPARKFPKAAVIFFHGANDTGQGVREGIKLTLDREFQFDRIKVIFPTAPIRPYTPAQGAPCSVWFDRQQVNPFCEESLDSIDATCHDMQYLIKREQSKGISQDKIILGGFSMGGAMAMHLAYRFCPDVAGVFALSSFLNENSAVYRAVELANQKKKKMPPLFCYYGRLDPVVSHTWAGEMCQKLLFSNVTVKKTNNTGMFHEMRKRQLQQLEDFILSILDKR